MEQKIDLDRLVCSFIDHTGNILEALEDQGLRYREGKLIELEKPNSIKFEEKPDTNNQAERASTTPENQEEEFLYHTPSASLWPYREEHYMLVDRDCARLLKLLRKILSSLPEHEVLPRLSYLQGVFEGSAMRRQQKIEKQMRTDI